MELILTLGTGGTVTVKNGAGELQYIAKFDVKNFSGVIYDELMLSELIAVQKTEEGFSLIAFDSPLGTFVKKNPGFVYECSQENLRISQDTGVFELLKDDKKEGEISAVAGGFKLNLDDDANVLMCVAEVLVIIAAKSLEKAKKSAIQKEKEAQVSENEAALSTDETTVETSKPSSKNSVLKLISKKFKTLLQKFKDIGGKDILETLKHGSKAAAVVSLCGIVAIVASAIALSVKSSALERLKTGTAVVINEDSVEITVGSSIFEFKNTEKRPTGEIYDVWYVLNDKGGFQKFYTSYPTKTAEKTVLITGIVALVGGWIIYVFTAFGVLKNPNFVYFKKETNAGVLSEDREEDNTQDDA